MHDEPPTPQLDADAATPVGPNDESTKAGDGVGFDPDAFEQAAAQFTPSWDHIPALGYSSADPSEAPREPGPERRGAPLGTGAAVLGTGEPALGTGEIDVPHGVEVVVPRPPRAPRIDVGRLGQAHDDDFGAAATELAVVRDKGSRTPWIAAAAVVFLVTLGAALWRGGQSPSERALAAPASAETTATPKPSPVVRSPAPTAPPAATLTAPEPAATAPEPAAARPVMPEASPVPSPKLPSASARPSEPALKKPEVPHSSASREQERPKRRAESAERPSASKPAGRKPKRGSGFVSVNPY